MVTRVKVQGRWLIGFVWCWECFIGCEILHFIPSQTSVSIMLYSQCTVSFYIPGGLCCSEICIQQTGHLHVLLKPLLSGNAWANTSLTSSCCFYYNYLSFQYLSILVLNCAGYSYCVLSEPAVWLFRTILNRLRKKRSIKVLLMKKKTHTQEDHFNLPARCYITS